MSQDECLSSPHHATYEGTCYVGSNFSITLSDATHPQPVNFHSTSVPEPATSALFALGLILGVLALRIRARGGKLG